MGLIPSLLGRWQTLTIMPIGNYIYILVNQPLVGYLMPNYLYVYNLALNNLLWLIYQYIYILNLPTPQLGQDMTQGQSLSEI